MVCQRASKPKPERCPEAGNPSVTCLKVQCLLSFESGENIL
jgi:hypothetical protein